MNEYTERLALHPLGVDEAAKIVRRIPRPGDSWASGYPSFDDIDLLESFIEESRLGRDFGVFGPYQIRRRSDAVVIGSVEFFGPPDEFGAVEVVGSIAEGHRHFGYGGEVMRAMVHIARVNGADYVIGSASIANVHAHEALLAGGLVEVVRDECIAHFAIDFGTRVTTD